MTRCEHTEHIPLCHDQIWKLTSAKKKTHFWSVSDSTSAVKDPEATYFNIAYYVFTDK